MKFCILFNLSPCARYCLLIGSQLTAWSQGNLHYIRLRVTNLRVTLFSVRSRIFLPIAQSCAALFCCRLAIRASSLGCLVGNKTYQHKRRVSFKSNLTSVSCHVTICLKRTFSPSRVNPVLPVAIGDT